MKLSFEQMIIRAVGFLVFSFVVTALLIGCTSTNNLSPAPTLFSETGVYPDDKIPPNLRTTTVELLYVTDRVETGVGTNVLSYGLERSPSMALGAITISFGDNLGWEALKQASQSDARGSAIKLEVQKIEELVRFPETPLPFHIVNGKVDSLPIAKSAYRKKVKELQHIIGSQLAGRSRKEAVLFVPGVNNSFEDGAFSLLNLWHLSGRVGVPILYSWPSGNPGLTGYFKDRESGEFSIFHLKQFIGMLASIPELERIHIIAHSRGADVITSSLRELVIAERSQGKSPKETLKISNLILAAPDLDFGVVRQRLIAERFGPAVGQISVFMNPSDGALAVSQRLMAGQRFGRLTVDDLNASDRRVFDLIKNVSFIDVETPGRGIGHAYFRDNPGVLSDIAIAISKNVPPGHYERPLESAGANFWRLRDGYPFAQ